MNIYIITLDTKATARAPDNKSPKFYIAECKADMPELSLKYKDSLDLHNRTIYVLRKDNHYDIIYKQSELKKYSKDSGFNSIFGIQPSPTPPSRGKYLDKIQK